MGKKKYKRGGFVSEDKPLQDSEETAQRAKGLLADDIYERMRKYSLRTEREKAIYRRGYVNGYNALKRRQEKAVKELKERVYTLQSEIEEDYFNDIRGDHLMFLTQSFLKIIDEVFGEVDS